MRKLPEIGKFYDCYDDGKIHESRKYKVKIISIIPFEKASLYLRAQWRKAQNSYYWIFARETDYFIIGNSYEREDEGVRIYNKVGVKDGCFGYIGEYSGELLPFCNYNVMEEIVGNIYDNPDLIKEE